MHLLKRSEKVLFLFLVFNVILFLILLLWLNAKDNLLAESRIPSINREIAEIELLNDIDISSRYFLQIEGETSWYGKPFHGRRTASGERFDMYKHTVAHRTLPFGTIIRVRNLRNGQTILVRVNDRGPFVRSRILDLSYGAAKKLSALGNPKVSLEALVPSDFDSLSSNETYYFGYSYNLRLICIPEDKMNIIEEFDDFEEAIVKYEYYSENYPNLSIYLFVPANQRYKNILHRPKLQFLVGYVDFDKEILVENRNQ
ncbi:MAG: septal ring lytic transglycosylase RlpA family protein [Ignavibacteria bacterium]|nr:septal ring lytic transglycosylase RlpA family protein [Ignavibacteria bacterium]